MLISIFLQATGGGNPLMSILPIILIIFIFYFFMIRPQSKKMKEEKGFRDSLGKGDKVVTLGGIHGRIVEVQEKIFMVEIDTNVKVRMEKTGISAEATKQYYGKDPEKTK